MTEATALPSTETVGALLVGAALTFEQHRDVIGQPPQHSRQPIVRRTLRPHRKRRQALLDALRQMRRAELHTFDQDGPRGRAQPLGTV